MTDARREKADDALLTIGELADRLGVPHHILRYWETRFDQLRPLQRSGRRRYYRPEDVALAHRIDALLNREGYTVRGVQQLLSGKPAPAPKPVTRTEDPPIERLKAIRTRLAAALADDGGAGG